MRVSTKAKAKAEALDIAKAKDGAEAKEITQMAKAAIKYNFKVDAKGIERMRAESKAR